MSHNYSIAVIVPVLNEQAALPTLLKQLQQLNADEVIVVDGGSTDESCKLLAASSVRWLSSSKGRSNQMNAGAALCQSDVLLFVHSDTVVDVTCLQAIKEVMQQPKIAGGRFDVRLSGAHSAFRMIAWFINQRSRLTGISTGDQCQFVRRSLFVQMGGFPVQSLMEDLEFSKRLKRLGKIASLKQKVMTSSRRWEKHGIRKTIILMWRLRWLYFWGVSSDRLATIYRQVR
ncbi:MAG: TIGR04283 family arsenosugar biosynthesis glycosyltransferase [Mariprofundus sp.]|nr:TIGR04283 family arsenosugar biosynthesis glycosyltransferase [Mariprofundus sp.]